MQVLVDAREKLEIPWEHPNTHLAANQAILFHSSNELDVDTFHQYAPVIHRLWQDRAIKKAYDRRREFQLVRTADMNDILNVSKTLMFQFFIFRATPSAIFSMIWIEYHGTIIYHHKKTSFTVAKQQKESLNLLLEYK